ncbi:MAG: sodium/proton-translocating pyrophosphatase, partial [Candidatus Coatesbacteria bacterium]
MASYSLFEKIALWTVFGSAFVGIGYALILVGRILKLDPGTPAMQKIAGAIQRGARAYLNRQFKTILLLTAVIGVAMFLTGETLAMQLGRAGAFLLGAFFSGLVGFVGMSLAVRGNVRCASAARSSYKRALTIAFQTGTIAGMFCVGLGLLGATGIFLLYGSKAYEVLIGFGFGGSLLALFMRVGGGIYTKAADVGADLVGKVEAGIPEDDSRNAAVIADLVGDNV